MPDTSQIFRTEKTYAHGTPCRDCHLRKCETFRELTEEELDFVEDFKSGEFRAEAGSIIYLEGSSSAHLFTILDGWAMRYKELEDGRRQVLNFALPGDFIGLQATIFDNMRHSVEALTDITLCKFERNRFFELYSNHPELAFDITWLAAREEKTIGDHLVAVGQRSAIERIGYIILHLYDRLETIGYARNGDVALPLKQQHLADMLGLSLVHTNKTLKKLNDTGLIGWRNGICHIRKRKELEAMACYEPSDELFTRPLI